MWSGPRPIHRAILRPLHDRTMNRPRLRKQQRKAPRVSARPAWTSTLDARTSTVGTVSRCRLSRLCADAVRLGGREQPRALLAALSLRNLSYLKGWAIGVLV